MKKLLPYRYAVFMVMTLYWTTGSMTTFAGDNTKIDSLKNALYKAKDMGQRAGIVKEIANEYSFLLQTDSAIAYGKMALSLFQSSGDKKSLGRAYYFLGQLYLKEDDYVPAEQYLTAAEPYFTDKDERVAALNHNLAFLNSYNKKPDKVIHYYRKNIDLFKAGEKVDKKYAMYAYEGIYGAYFMQQQYSSALNAVNEYVGFLERNDPGQLAKAYLILGDLYRMAFDYRKSITAFEKGFGLLKEKGDSLSVANVKMGMARSYFLLKKNDTAREYINEALQYYRSVDSPTYVAGAFNMLSAIAFEEKNYDLAEKYIADAIRLDNKENGSFVYHNSFLWTVRLSKLVLDTVSLKRDKKSREALERVTDELTRNFEVIRSSKEYLSPGLFLHNYGVLAEANELLGNYELALFYLKKKLEFKDSIYNVEKLIELTNKDGELGFIKERNRITLEEETKRLQLQKQAEMEALRYEYERKRELARTEDEKKRLLLEEELKRNEIEIKYEEEQKAITLRYEHEKKLKDIEQEKKDALAAAELSRTRNIRNMSAMGVGLALLLSGITGWFYFQKRKDNRRIAIEKQKSDQLLLNILPHEVAEELKQKGATPARSHDNVSVLFTDFVNFTSNSEKIGVQELLNELNVCFTAFDNIMEKHGLEKIKTIGDAYLAVSGLPLSSPLHARNAVNAALDILSFISERKMLQPNALDLRIGIHSGPVIAGIVGVKKFAYDIWGDTVNTAARMEQGGAMGKINISDTTYQLIKNDFVCTYRGKIPTKGKGDMDMYFVEK